MSEPVENAGKRPPGTLDSTAGKRIDGTVTLACDHLREDHRGIEAHLDRLLAILQHLSAERIPEVQSIVGGIQQLSAVHFEKEERILYPWLRSIQPDLLDQMDRQHAVIREVETHVAEMLADPPLAPDIRWLNELRSFGTEFHDHIQHHIVDEEDHLFRMAESNLTIEEQATLADAMVTVQKGMAQSGTS